MDVALLHGASHEPAYEEALPGRDGRPTVAGGMLLPPGVADHATAAAIVAASDRRDTRPLDEVRGEIRRRAGGDDPAPAPDGGNRPAPAPDGDATGRDGK